jgi:hypothetical protein
VRPPADAVVKGIDRQSLRVFVERQRDSRPPEGLIQMILMAMLVAAMCVMLIAPWPVSKAD